MYHALIVDDESHAVRGIQAGVRWEQLNIATVHVAYNIRQAREIFESHPVHVMVCDIEMPQGSGLDLLAWVREQYPRTETIFLTCHADFSYAKQALQLGSFDYMLKPVDYEELENVLEKALDKIRKDQEIVAFEEIYRHYYKLWEAHQPMVMERFWQDLIHQAIPSTPDQVKAYLEKQNIRFHASMRFLPVLIQVQRWHKELSSREERIMEYALQNAAEEQIARNVRQAMVVSIGARKLLAVIPVELPGTPTPAAMEEQCKAYIGACSGFFYCDLCCYIGEAVLPHEMLGMVHELQKLDANNVTRTNEMFVLNKMKKSGGPILLPQMKEWAEMMKQGTKHKLLAEVTRYLDSLRHVEGGINAEWLHIFYQDFMQMIFFVLHVKGVQAHQVFSKSLLTEKPEAALRSLKALQEWVEFVIEAAMNHMHSALENKSIVEKVKQYIAENIGQQALSRKDIANYVYLNPDYLTRLFKKETGMSLSDYMQQQRIECAKELLTTTVNSISDIALTSGYSNLSYFSTIFKRATRMNPIEFRKHSQQR
ncbi:response regulator [Paenibacillus sp. GCM10027629]|uniref:response regulator n=1 Tax=Paenibacillus sp. GCM10027629 TaxID=3273414 RepID=UPI0036323F3F